MKKLSCIILFAAFILNISAQDLIIKKNGTELISKILEVDSNDIKYKKFDNLDGPTYIISKSDVFIIKYANGTKDIINRMDVPEISEQNKDLVNEKKLFHEQKSYISAGYGFGTYFNSLHSNYNDREQSTSLLGPIYGKYEYAVNDEFGIGICLAYLRNKLIYLYTVYDQVAFKNVEYTETDISTSFSALLHANWHFGNSDKVDPYFGFGLGYRSFHLEYSNNDPQGTPRYESSYHHDNNSFWGINNTFPIGFEATFGVRIKFSERMGAYAETGIAKSVVQVGFVTKF